MKPINIINEEVGRFLNEAKAIDIWNKYYNNIPKNDFYKIIAADPTTNIENDKLGKFSKWLLALYKKNELRLEDLYKATDYLKKFIKYRNVLDIKDITKYKSLPHLYKELEKITGELKTDTEIFTKEKAAEFIRRGDAKLIYEDGDWLIIIPKTKEASIYFGSHTQWCTASADPKRNKFKDYHSNGYLFNLINKHNRKKDYLLFIPSVDLDKELEFANIYNEQNNKFDEVTNNNIELFKTILSNIGKKYVEKLDYNNNEVLKTLKHIINLYYDLHDSNNIIPKKIILEFINSIMVPDKYGFNEKTRFFIEITNNIFEFFDIIVEKIMKSSAEKINKNNIIRILDYLKLINDEKYKNVNINDIDKQEIYNLFDYINRYSSRLGSKYLVLFRLITEAYIKPICDLLYDQIGDHLFKQFDSVFNNDRAMYYFNLYLNIFLDYQKRDDLKDMLSITIPLPDNLEPPKEKFNSYLDLYLDRLE